MAGFNIFCQKEYMLVKNEKHIYKSLKKLRIQSYLIAKEPLSTVH